MHFHSIKEKTCLRLFYSAIEPHEKLDLNLEIFWNEQWPSFFIRNHGLGDDYDWTIHLSFFIGFYFSISHPWIRRQDIQDDKNKYYSKCLQLYYYDEKEAIGYCDPCIHWNLWTYEDNGEDYGWREGTIFLQNIIFGDLQSEFVKDSEPSPISISMPEGVYPAFYQYESVVHNRKRWLKSISFPRTEITFDSSKFEGNVGIPYPGKGENSWDCGDDATFSFGCPNHSYTIAIHNLTEYVMKKRRNNKNWRPSEDWSIKLFKFAASNAKT